jgi:hypothetical protein
MYEEILINKLLAYIKVLIMEKETIFRFWTVIKICDLIIKVAALIVSGRYWKLAGLARAI